MTGQDHFGSELSLLDRLIDDEPQGTQHRRTSDSARHQLFRESLRRDIESLLNARRRFLRIPSQFPEAARSFIEYGVPDFTNEGYSTKDHREKLRREIETALTQHEPRLRTVHVELLDRDDATGGPLRFRILAHAYVSSHTEALLFDTAIEPVDWSVKVEEGR